MTTSTSQTGSTLRILLVDEEPVVQSLQRALRMRCPECQVRTANNTADALDALTDFSVDIVICELRLAPKDGLHLLQWLQIHHPYAARIVLSASSDDQEGSGSTAMAHQFLAKPVDLNRVTELVDRVDGLRRVLPMDSYRKLAGNLNGLPPVPRLFAELRAKLQSEDSSLDEISDLIERDPAIGSKILQVVNSAFFGLPQPTSSVKRAISYLGARVVQGLVLSIGAAESLPTLPRGTSLERIQHDGLLASTLVRRVFRLKGTEAEDAFTAALMHDIGFLVPDAENQYALAEAWELASARRVPLVETEREVRGVTHGQIGAYLLGLWGLPNAVVEAVAMHDESQPSKRLDVNGAVYLASWLAEQCTTSLVPSPEPDPQWLEGVGLAGALPRLIEAARELCGAPV